MPRARGRRPEVAQANSRPPTNSQSARGIAPSYMTLIMRLTLLAPDIVEAILDGKQGPEVTLARVLEPFPAGWEAQKFDLS